MKTAYEIAAAVPIHFLPAETQEKGLDITKTGNELFKAVKETQRDALESAAKIADAWDNGVARLIARDIRKLINNQG